MTMSDDEFEQITREIDASWASERRHSWKVLAALFVVMVVVVVRWRWAA